MPWSTGRTAHPTQPLLAGPEDIAAPPVEPVAAVDALAQCLECTLGELSADDTTILRACDLAGQSQREFADAQGLSLPAAKSRLLRARRRLRERLVRVCQLRFEPDGSVAGHLTRTNAV